MQKFKKIIAIIAWLSIVPAMYLVAGTVTKGLIGKQDISLWDGTSTKTFTRDSSEGYTLTLNQLDWVGVDVLQKYGGGVNRTNGTLTTALAAVGAVNDVAFWLSPGAWTITDDITITSNINLYAPPGALLTISSGKTLTINGPLIAGMHQVFSGSGTVVFGAGYISRTLPEWWGIDGTADNIQIQLAITAAAAINIPAELNGTSYSVSGSITLPANATIRSPEKTATITLVANTDASLFLVTGDDVTVRNIKADGAKASQASGSFLKVEDQAGSIDGLVVENCVITDFKEYGIQVANACANHKFINNKIDSVDKGGILVSPDTVTEICDNITMERNHVISAGVNGLQVYNSTNSNNSNIFIKNNYLIDITAVPIEIQRGVNGTVSENIIEGSGTNGISVGSCQYVTVSDNIIKDQSNYGIEMADISEGGNFTITGNSIYNCGTGIITVDGGGDYGSVGVISNNVIDTTTSQEGIDSQHVSKLSIIGNVIFDPETVGIRVHGVDDAIEALSDIMVSNNVINFTAASTSGPQGISVASISGGIISNNQVISAISGSGEYDAMIGIGKGNKNLYVVDNQLIGTVAIAHTGISVTYSNSGSFIYLLRNHIRLLRRGIISSANTDPRVYISGNIIEESSVTDITAHASHRLDKIASSPTQGAMWNIGDVVWETAPASGSAPGWICLDRVKTEMRVAAVGTDTTMEVDSTTGMTGGDIVGVEQNDGTWKWTTVASVTDGDTFELTAGLDSAAAINNDVITNLWNAMPSLP